MQLSRNDLSKFQIYISVNDRFNLEPWSIKKKVINVQRHPLFSNSGDYYRYDIALLKLDVIFIFKIFIEY
jgi:hypothetical protein